MGSSGALNDETKRVLQNCDASALKPGMNYLLPFYFSLLDKDGNRMKSPDQPHYSIGGNRDLTKQLGGITVVAYK